MSDETAHMSGPQHYRQAELLLASINGKSIPTASGQATIAAAQVHATLALAAATASRAMIAAAATGATIEDGPGTWNEAVRGGAS